VSGYTMGGFVHVLPVIAIVVLVVRSQTTIAIWTLHREGEVSGKEVKKMAKGSVCGMETNEKKAPHPSI
jgi:uncharacterized membrane protein YfcA